MNNEHEPKNGTTNHAKPDTFVVDGNGEWLVASGHEPPRRTD